MGNVVAQGSLFSKGAEGWSSLHSKPDSSTLSREDRPWSVLSPDHGGYNGRRYLPKLIAMWALVE